MLDPDTGYAHFPVSYLALVFRPFKNEVLVAKVSTVNNVSQLHSPTLLHYTLCTTHNTQHTQQQQQPARVDRQCKGYRSG